MWCSEALASLGMKLDSEGSARVKRVKYAHRVSGIVIINANIQRDELCLRWMGLSDADGAEKALDILAKIMLLLLSTVNSNGPAKKQKMGTKKTSAGAMSEQLQSGEVLDR
eukprot:scaffold2544_cov269-Chaetoceros_neogracile.AAC.14